VLAIGGIAKKSKFVMQVCADVLNVPIKVAKSEQACALGAAMFAAVASGVHPTMRKAMDSMNSGFDAEYFPNPENVKLYNGIYERYCGFAAVTEKEIMKTR